MYNECKKKTFDHIIFNNIMYVYTPPFPPPASLAFSIR